MTLIFLNVYYFSILYSNLCKNTINYLSNCCDNDTCVEAHYSNSSSSLISTTYDINVNLSDHTGTLINCHLTRQFADELLQISPLEFQQLTIHERTQLKWKFLLNRFAVKLLVKRKSIVKFSNYITIVEMLKDTPENVANKIKVY